MKIYLASHSPRRQELLTQIGIEFELIDIEINEDWDGIEIPKDYVQRMALEKAQAGMRARNNNTPVLAADTCVVLDGNIIGKANTDNEARLMLRQLSGRRHIVYTAIALINDQAQTTLNINHVSFRPLSDKDIDDYCKSQEPIGKAGAYAIQGRAAAFIERLDGSYSGVMGLPLYETESLLDQLRNR